MRYRSLQTATRRIFNEIHSFWSRSIGNDPNFILTVLLDRVCCTPVRRQVTVVLVQPGERLEKFCAEWKILGN